eukprot:NODE_1296_length_1008_cov_281.084463_g901_i0.p4 GENE.NODE_1296_length_1008_cov_281.084463_g901_i0~~NODE_1296_length_1008_cov_281.084463_g901_i0.p4  ORF type:complete len:64 (-),score=32.34 NODE_1296_length_1008_cov_281.084463_g901_i0:5-196(-)
MAAASPLFPFLLPFGSCLAINTTLYFARNVWRTCVAFLQSFSPKKKKKKTKKKKKKKKKKTLR